MAKPDEERLRHILIVEDEVLIAMELEDRVQALGYAVCGPAPTVAIAADLLEQQTPDAALLDVNLNGETVAPLAHRLQELNIPYVLITGYARLSLRDPALAGAPRLGKPVGDVGLARAIHRMLCG